MRSTSTGLNIGSLDYYADYKILDMVGLINPVIAKQSNQKFHEKHNADNILANNPDVILLTTRTNPIEKEFVSDYWIGETALYEHPEFKQKYNRTDKIWKYTFDGKTEYVVLFEKSKTYIK